MLRCVLRTHARTHSEKFALSFSHTFSLIHTRALHAEKKGAYPPSYRGHLGLPSVSRGSVVSFEAVSHLQLSMSLLPMAGAYKKVLKLKEKKKSWIGATVYPTEM